MPEPRRITHQFLEAVRISDSRFDRVLIPALMLIGVFYAGEQVLQRDWLRFGFFLPWLALMLALVIVKPLQRRVLRQRVSRRHALYFALLWVYSAVWIHLLRLLVSAQPTGKASGYFYALGLGLIAVTVMMIRALLILLSPRGYRFFVTQIPLWEQMMVAANEAIAAGLLAGYLGANVLTRLLQPSVFTTRVDLPYTLGLTITFALFYVGMQSMWIQRANDWLSQNTIWVRLARIIWPFELVVVTLVIARRFVERAEPRTANLLGDAAVDLAVLSLGAVIWLVILIITGLVYTSGRGLRQRFLPDLLLDRLPKGMARLLRTISDMDMLLILVLFSTLIPAYLFLLGDRGGLIGALQQQILLRGSALIETSEQALALLFAIPFYLLAVILLALYAFVLSRPWLSAQDRDELVSKVPIGFLIVLIITLYLFAIPFSQVLTAGRLPQLPQDMGRILAFNVLIPLGILYGHYFLLVRLPYGRGQSRWRDRQSVRLLHQQQDFDQRIDSLNREVVALDLAWASLRQPDADADTRMETLYRYMQLNGMRDDLNMQRLQLINARQQLAEVSEAPVSLAVARLPLRIVSLGIPLLLAIQVYQWAVLNNGLHEIINNPNITIDEFFRILLHQVNF